MINFSLEYFPPNDQESFKSLIEQATVISTYSPHYMSITHTANPMGKNPTMQTVEILRKQLAVRVTPHMTCINYSKTEIMQMVQDYSSLGVDSVVALRGNKKHNHRENEPCFDNSPEFISALNDNFDFRISISGYPEGHPERKGIIADFLYLKKKCDAGADEIITQWCFSNDTVLRYRDLCASRNINVPISIGILPISDIEKTQHFAKLCGSVIPIEIKEAFNKSQGNDKATEDLGVRVAIQQMENLSKEGIDNFHLYTLNRSEMTKRIIQHFAVPSMGEIARSEMRAS